MNRANRWKMGALAALAIAAQASAGFIDITGGYNVLSFGDFTSQNDQIAGKLAASGDVTIATSYSVGYALSAPSTYSLVAGGDVTLSNGSVQNGGLLAGGDVSLTNVNVDGNVVEFGNVASQIDFNSTKNQLATFSDQLASTTSNSVSEVKWGGLFLTGTNAVNYFSIDASDFENISYLQYSVPTNSVVIINVTGTSVDLGGNFGVNGLSKSDAGNVLFNFVDATSLTLGSSIGTVLALNATVSLTGGEIWGDLVSGSVSGTSEFHLAHYTGEVPPPNDVPEASTTIMMVFGSLVLAFASRKKFSFSRK
jgi:choice-of-anchor A domain-containing protein